MKYYLVAPLSNSPLLTYLSNVPLQKGELVSIPIRKSKQLGIVWEEVKKPDFQCKELELTEQFFLPHQILLGNFIAQYYCASLGMSFKLFVPLSCAPSELIPKECPPLLTLSSKQQEVFECIQTKPFALLFGETGSGKSEIYIYLISKTLKEGKTALLLMPEIALTPQMQSRLGKVFGDCMGVWHSKMSKKQKQNIINKIQNGEIRLILGARSALFLPLPSLGLIVVDEEHDDAYKSQSSPYYNARDLAIYLGDKQNIQVLLGSATPSTTSYYLAKKQHAIFHLKKHYPSRISLQCLHQKAELSEEIFDAINQTLQENRQILVFLPTRANFKYLICNSCGMSIQCPFCSISMSLHLKNHSLACHYCGYTQSIPNSCPTCQSTHFISQRIGTAQVAQELQERFSNAKIAIFDRDHITTQKTLESTLKDFEKQKIDILVGTQMLSKGHDYHNIGLVVIMGLDSILSFGDFRSRERAMSLFFQIKGRAGRKENGKVILQSLNCDFFSIQNYEEFLEEELRFREGIYPPFSKLATLTFSSTSDRTAQKLMQEAMEQLCTIQEIQVVGGGKAFIEKINSKYRYVILLRSSHSIALLKAIRTLKTPCEIDIDPLNIV